MLDLKISRNALKFLETLPDKHLRQIRTKLANLQQDPQPPDSIQMKGKSSDWRRADAGEYRIIYRVEGNSLFADAIGRRNDDRVYREFERKL